MKKKSSEGYVAAQVYDLKGLAGSGMFINVSRAGRTGRKRGVRTGGSMRDREVDLTMQVSDFSDFYDPAHLLALRLQDAITKANQVCPVKLYPERTGETAQLADPAAQLRSIAAILVKKYRLVAPTLMAYYPALRKRELTPAECHEIVECASKLGLEEKNQAQALWLKILENGGEQTRLREQLDEEEENQEGEMVDDDLEG